MIAVLEIGGHRFEQRFAPAALLDATFYWDGHDAGHTFLHGAVQGYIGVGYVYPAEYRSAGQASTLADINDKHYIM